MFRAGDNEGGETRRTHWIHSAFHSVPFGDPFGDLDECMAVCSAIAMPAYPDERTPPTSGVEDSKGVPFPSAQGTQETPISEQRAVRGSTKPSAALSPHRSGVGPAGPMLETDRYSNFRLISDKGGSGIVVQALDNDVLREVAIKIFHVADDGSEIDRYAEEARINGQLEHPNIVPVYELGTDLRGRRFLCMKLVKGATLDETLNRLGESRLAPTNLADLLQVFVKICDAVSFAHSRGVLHRDLKPTNVMISDFGQVYVLDWGIARLRPPIIGEEGPRVRVSSGSSEQSEPDAQGSLVGTACYMAPEQLQGKHETLDERTDVFALGGTLYQILTGQPPLTAEIARAIWMRKSPPPIARPASLAPEAAVPVELSHIALRALSYDPEERYQSVAELKGAVEWFQRGAWDMPRERFSAGAVVIVEGEPGEAAYVILEGECVAYHVENGAEIQLRKMGVGDVFGETAVFSERPRTASVKALSNVLLLVVTRDVLSRALGLHSWMGAFVKTLADRFREADERLRGVKPVGRLVPVATLAEPTLPHAPSQSDVLADLLRDVASSRRGAADVPRVSLPAGTVIVAEGDPGEAAFVILGGQCVEYRGKGARQVDLRTLNASEVFGEASVFSGKPGISSVRAITDVTLLKVTRDVLTKALGLNSWMGTFVTALADRFREADERLRALEDTK